MESLATIVINFQALTIVTKLSILDVCDGTGSASGICSIKHMKYLHLNFQTLEPVFFKKILSFYAKTAFCKFWSFFQG